VGSRAKREGGRKGGAELSQNGKRQIQPGRGKKNRGGVSERVTRCGGAENYVRRGAAKGGEAQKRGSK